MEVTIDLILQAFKNYTEEKRMKDIKNYVVSVFNTNNELLFDKQGEIELEVERVIKEDKKLDKESSLVYSNGKYKKRKNKKPVNDGEAVSGVDSVFIGAAGELAVMSELVFRGYNANRMTIDKGVDIIATKDNIFYYIQVKTTFVKDGRIYAQIPRIRFDQYMSNQLRYVVVARYKDKANENNMYFVFPSYVIDKGVHDGCIKINEDTISIKIRFNQMTGLPELYDVKSSDASYYLNRFL